MLNLLGTIGGNVLSLPGILGLAAGMTTRRWIVGAIFGGTIGIMETLIFAGFSLAGIGMLELIVAILVGIAAGVIGSLIRIKGTTV